MSCKCGLAVTPKPDRIIVHGAREHNLKGICFEIPKNKLVALTGPSGSGKSSIAVGVLQKECLRQFLESLGMTTDHLEKAKVDSIMGLSPSIGVTQAQTDFNPRSTVGTKTGISTILRNLFAALSSQGDQQLTMAHFSPNASKGACEGCRGSGEITHVDLEKVLNEAHTLRDGGVRLWDQPLAAHYEKVIMSASRHYQFAFDPSLPIGQYTKEQRDFLLYGIAHPPFAKAHKEIKRPKKISAGKYEGIRYPADADCMRCETCPNCSGSGLGKIGREVTVGGQAIVAVGEMSLDQLLKWVRGLNEEAEILRPLVGALVDRIENLIEVGMDYLTLNRTLPSLSAGEAQRLRLACVLGSGLTGVLYVLDEPTTGLHPHDTAKLIRTLRKIQAGGNTVLVIEHDTDLIRQVDHVIEIGPGGGSEGGRLVACGPPATLLGAKRERRVWPSSPPVEFITVRDACKHNLKGINISIPIGKLVTLTGVSGSGKSTFLFGVLEEAMRGDGPFSRIVTVSQKTIRKTNSSRSNVATYTKLFDQLRDLYASLPAARARGLGADKFSFNTSDARCERCNGAGVVAIDMAFLPDVEMGCPVCQGRRFNEEILGVTFEGMSITDLLDLTVSDALPLFEAYPLIHRLLALMEQVGLGYLTLGQSTSTLSGGEAQRIKLAKELARSGAASTLYLLDEPTAGLHPDEVEKLLTILRGLVAKGHTVVAIEHNLDAIHQADWIIDFGPGGGVAGGEIVAAGTPQEVAANSLSLTGRWLNIAG